ncbi:MAG TPA: hypothetical protein VH518_03460 [Tepidisphaeraceae bacterium]
MPPIAAHCPVCGRAVAAGSICSHGAPSGMGRAAATQVPPASPAPLMPLEHTGPSTTSRRSLFQILLDPRSIQWMLGSGAVLLVTGIIIWLASIGVFENPYVVSACLGTGTILLLGAGWWVIKRTDLQLAGRAVTLLACLVMPLNLWFYHSHHLLALDGNLWMAAVVCCVLYAASAMVLRDPLFVYVLMAGVAGTGMLILTDLGRFAEIAAPCMMLAVMGLIGIHVERAFAPTGDGPFTRKSFGKAFFHSGHSLLAGALLLLAGAQVAGWFITPAFPNWNLPAAVITTDPTLKLVALAIVLAAAYAYTYSDLIVQRAGRYTAAAIMTLLWAQLLGLQLLNIPYKSELILSALAVTSLGLLSFSRITGGHPAVRRGGIALMSLASISTSFMVASRLLNEQVGWSSGALLAGIIASSIGASVLVGRESGWRRGFTVMNVINAALLSLVMAYLSHLTGWQKVEVVTVMSGVALLATGHVGWYREQATQSDSVTFNLSLGALLAGVPLLIAAVVHRFGGTISLPDELGLVTISSLMLMTGLMFELRSTTITGGLLLTLHIMMLLASATWEAQLAVGVYLSVGGGLIFLVGLLLAIYRERLLQIPGRIQRREGVFRVLAWR